MTHKEVPTSVARSMNYFDKRARRYAMALDAFPHARVLDTLPYCYLFRDVAERLGKPVKELKILDAFGGTGFITRSFPGLGGQITIADCSHMMLEEVGCGFSDKHIVEVTDNFENLAEERAGYFDVVLTHGGLHHVIKIEGDEVDSAKSLVEQTRVISRLGQLVTVGGSLLIADIPDKPLSQCLVGRSPKGLTKELPAQLLDAGQVSSLDPEIVGLLQADLFTLAEGVRSHYGAPLNHPVPRYFFDEFVAKRTPLGHEASFFPPLEQTDALGQSFALDWRCDYLGPWIFPNREAAGWYFREKFSVGEPDILGNQPADEVGMAVELENTLGGRETPEKYCVNWGVVYSNMIRRN